MTDKAFLIWIHERFRLVHGEDQLCDYMHKLRSIIAATPPQKTTPNINSGNCIADILLLNRGGEYNYE